MVGETGVYDEVDARLNGQTKRRLAVSPLDMVRIGVEAFAPRLLKFVSLLLVFACVVFVTWQPHLYTLSAAGILAALVAPLWWRKESA